MEKKCTSANRKFVQKWLKGVQLRFFVNYLIQCGATLVLQAMPFMHKFSKRYLLFLLDRNDITKKNMPLEKIPKVKFKKFPNFETPEEGQRHTVVAEKTYKLIRNIEKYCSIATEKQIEFLITLIKPYYEQQDKTSLGFPPKYNLSVIVPS
jgi:hypothetical protein